MSNRTQSSHGSGKSSDSARVSSIKVRCSCGNDAVVRTVKNGPDVGTRFYGCSKWPNTQCKLYVPIDDKRLVEDLQLKLLERDTEIAELEMIRKFNEDRITELEKKNKELAPHVETLKTEGWEQKLVATRAYTNQKHLSLALFVALIVIVVVNCLK